LSALAVSSIPSISSARWIPLFENNAGLIGQSNQMFLDSLSPSISSAARISITPGFKSHRRRYFMIPLNSLLPLSPVLKYIIPTLNRYQANQKAAQQVAVKSYKAEVAAEAIRLKAALQEQAEYDKAWQLRQSQP
jgi:hypothetical protein